MAVYALEDLTPDIDESAYVHPDAVVIGRVKIGPQASIWPSAVLRGDYGYIEVGARTSVQDGTIVHATAELSTIIGADCTVGHNAHLEGCTVEDGVLIGSGSTVLHRAIIRTGSLVGANALVPNNMEVPTGCMALGVPAKLRENAVRPGHTRGGTMMYARNAERYKQGLKRLD